jgi:heme-degrading monooxygenase HmoA
MPRRQSRPELLNTPVILRIWKAEIDPARGDEYERFAQERSLPMFRAHRGFRGCAFLRSGADCTMVTLWDRPEDIAALEASTLYRETVTTIMATGFIRTTEDSLAVPVLL